MFKLSGKKKQTTDKELVQLLTGRQQSQANPLGTP